MQQMGLRLSSTDRVDNSERKERHTTATLAQGLCMGFVDNEKRKCEIASCLTKRGRNHVEAKWFIWHTFTLFQREWRREKVQQHLKDIERLYYKTNGFWLVAFIRVIQRA